MTSTKPPKAVTAALEALRRAVEERQRLDERIEQMAAQRAQASTRKAAAASAIMKAELRGGEPPEQAVADMREAEQALARLEGLAAASGQAKAELSAAAGRAAEDLRLAVDAWAAPMREEVVKRYRQLAAELLTVATEIDQWSHLLGRAYGLELRIPDPLEHQFIHRKVEGDMAFAQFETDVRMLTQSAQSFLREDRKLLEKAA